MPKKIEKYFVITNVMPSFHLIFNINSMNILVSVQCFHVTQVSQKKEAIMYA